MMTNERSTDRRDRGNALPLVLVVGLVLGAVVAAIASYTVTTIRYGHVVEASAQRVGAAQGAMDDMLGRLGRNSSLCTTALGKAEGETSLFTDPINGITPLVRCRVVGTTASSAQAWAVILTGELGGEVLRVSQGGGNPNARKSIVGNIFVSRNLVTDGAWDNFNADLVVKGDMHFYKPDCTTETGVDGALFPSPVVVPSRWHYEDGHRTSCSKRGWADLFLNDAPIAPNVSDLPLRNVVALPEDGSGCTVWEPGKYTATPQLSSHNYFRSGDYFFDNIGTWTISNWTLAGAPATQTPTILDENKPVASHPCYHVWNAETLAGNVGATFFMGGSSQISVDGGSSANPSLEISGRPQGLTLVSMQALPSSNPPGGDILTLGSGTKKQVAIMGMLWAPYAGVALENVANGAIGQLNGGAVISRLHAGAPATQPPSLVVRVLESESTGRLLLTSVADHAGGRAAVQAEVLYRPSDGAYSIESRRVMGLTPDDLIPTFGAP